MSCYHIVAIFSVAVGKRISADWRLERAEEAVGGACVAFCCAFVLYVLSHSNLQPFVCAPADLGDDA